MSRTTQHSARRRDAAPALGGVMEGAFTACLGLAVVAIVSLLLWTTSPYPDSGPGGALRVAAGLWLLAHGADLVRADTLSGVPAPLGVTPLLLTALPVWLLYRAVRAQGGGGRAVWSLGAGYLAVAGAVVGYSVGGSPAVDPLSAALHLPLLTLGTLAVGAWLTGGRWGARPTDGVGDRESERPRLSRWARRVRAGAASRAAGVAVAVLCGGGALLAAAGLLWRWSAARDAFPQLTSAWSGQLAVLLLCVALLPNVAVWGAAYGLGPGFTLGAGSVVGPLATTAHPALPHFPLLAAVPGEGAGGPVLWVAAGAVPLAAGWAAGWSAARSAVPVPGTRHGATSWGGTLGTALLGALGCGLAMGALGALAGGPLGTGTLAHLGPVWWQTGAAALGWTVLVSAPGALTVRLWRLRDPHPLLATALVWRRFAAWCGSLRGPAGAEPAGEWHATGARLARWAALKEASGGLVPDFEPRWGGDTEEPTAADRRRGRHRRAPRRPRTPNPRNAHRA
ncbi:MULTISPECIES: cell division protein PerM [Streptomyces]|uniref:cell division protein PerM n=1 Tax=Streptomyces TaxID=1883 RepID=UPI002248D595|nr:DUF6350 family protein [Streptomyces sp. JHD 1]MCX2971504.1 DUF6350 family protein [Streptomyces sp. JHD 1]